MPAAIFDLNGVFIESRPLSERFLEDYGIPIDQFLPVLSSIMEAARRPGADDIYTYWEPHLARWKLDLTREQFLRYWFEAEQEDPQMVTLVQDLRRNGWQLFTLSNNFRERTRYYEQRFAFLQSLTTYYSWRTGNVKPDPQCFVQIIDENGLDPKECHYFDDSEKNVAAARAQGIQAHKYESSDQVRRITGL